MKTNYIQIRADDQLKANANKLADHYGLSVSAVITMLIKRDVNNVFGSLKEEKKMTRYFIWDDELTAKAAIFNEESFEDCEKAIKKADYLWSQKTDGEKKACDEFFVGLFSIDEEDLPEDCIEIIKRYK